MSQYDQDEIKGVNNKTVSDAVTDIASLNTKIGTPVGADVSTDIANVQTEVDKIGTPVDTNVCTDIANVQTAVDAIVTATVTTASTTTAGTIVQDGTTGTPNTVQVTTNASANTFGSWGTIDASVSADSWIMGVSIATAGTANIAYVTEIGIGAGPTTIVRFSFKIWEQTAAGYHPTLFVPFPIPIKVASGTAISCRAACSVAIAHSVEFGLSMYQGLET